MQKATLSLVAGFLGIGLALQFFAAEREASALYRAQEQERQLIDYHGVLADQFSAADAVTAALIDEQIDFPTAVQQLLDINRDRIGFPEVLATFCEGETHVQRVARWAIHRARTALDRDPSRQKEVTDRLDRDYRRMFNLPSKAKPDAMIHHVGPAE